MSNLPAEVLKPVEVVVLPPKVGPVSMPPPSRENIPANLKVDHNHDASEFFSRHVEANPAVARKLAEQGVVVASPKTETTAPPVTPPPVPPVAAPAPVAKVEEPAAPAKGSISERLVAKGKSVVPATEPVPVSGAKNPEDQITLDPKYTQAAHESFAQIKTITSGLRDQLNAARETERQLKTQLDAAKSGAPAPEAAEIDRLRTEHKQMSDRLMLVDLREHPKFQAEFVAPQEAALNEASAILSAHGVTNADLKSLLLKPRGELGKAVAELAKSLPQFDQGEFSENIRKAWNLNQQASTALSKSREVYGAMRNQTETSQKQAFDRTWGRAAGQVSEHIVELETPDNASQDERTAIDQYNAAFKGLRTVAEQRAFGAATPEAISEHAIKSAAYDFHIQQAMPRMLKEFENLIGINRGLVAHLNAIKARNPNLQVSGASGPAAGGGAGPDGTLSHAELSKMSHADAAAALATRRLS